MLTLKHMQKFLRLIIYVNIKDKILEKYIGEYICNLGIHKVYLD